MRVGGLAERIFETAAGTGLTRALAASLPGAVEIVATDLESADARFRGGNAGR